MKRLLLSLIAFSMTSFVFSDINNPPLNIEETDGSPSTYPYKLKVSPGTLTDNGDGTATLTSGGGGGTGDITAVLVSGDGIAGGGSSGDVTIVLGSTVAFTTKNQTFTQPQTFSSSITVLNPIRHMSLGNDLQIESFDTTAAVVDTYDTRMTAITKEDAGSFGEFYVGASTWSHRGSTYGATTGPNVRFLPSGTSGSAYFDSGKRYILIDWDAVSLIPSALATAPTPLRFYDAFGGGGGYVALVASDTVPSDITFRLPATDGTSGQVLHTTGEGSWYFDTDDTGGAGGGDNLGSHVATMTVTVGYGITGTTFTATSTSTIAGTQLYTHINSEPAYQNFTTSAAVITTTMNLMPRDTQGVCPLNIWDNTGNLATAVSVAGEWDINRAVRINSTADSTTPEIGTKNGIAFNNYSQVPGNFVSIHLNNAIGGDSAGLYMVNVTTAGQFGGPIQRQGRILFYTGTEADGFTSERLRLDEYGRLISPSFVATTTSMTVVGSGGLTVTSLGAQTCVGTDSNGKFQAGTCGGGGGSSSLAVWDGTVKVSSPTESVRFDPDQFIVSLLGSATAFVAINGSSVTMRGADPSLGGDLSGTISNASVSDDSHNHGDSTVADDITLTNITQITNRSHTSLSDIGTNTHAQIDTRLDDIGTSTTTLQSNINLVGVATGTINTDLQTSKNNIATSTNTLFTQIDNKITSLSTGTVGVLPYQVSLSTGVMSQIGDTSISDGAVDGGSGGEIADASITADDLATDSVGELELVESMNFTPTGTWNYGGAAGLELPNGTGPTVDAEGEIAFDTTDDVIVAYDGTAARVYADSLICETKVIGSSGTWDNQAIPIYQAHPNGAITLVSVHAAVLSGTSLTYNIEERAQASLASAGTDIYASDQAADADGEDESSFSNAGIAAGAHLVFTTGSSAASGAVGYISMRICYRRDVE